MVEVPLLAGAYSARSIIASAQRCVNLYPEVNQRESFLYLPQQIGPTLTTHYPTPGLRPLTQCPTIGEVRGLYRSSNNNLYAVVANVIYYIGPGWQWQFLGYMATNKGFVRMDDNGQTLVIVDGSPFGFTVNIDTNNVAGTIADSAFYGSNSVTALESYMFFNKPGTPFFYSTLSGQVSPFDATYIAEKSGYSDYVQGVIAVDKNLWVIGTVTTEVWYLNGGATFPVGAIPQGMSQWGCMAAGSIVRAGDYVMWLGQNQQGSRVVLMGNGYNAQRVTTHAIEQELDKYPVVSDATAFAYQQQGHYFYVLNIPSADKTWVYDIPMAGGVPQGEWHERLSIDSNGAEHRHRANCAIEAFGRIVVGDYANGMLYEYDLNAFTDNGQPVKRVRGFPHILQDGNRVSYQRFVANMQTGAAQAPDPGLRVALRMSDDRGATYWGPRYVSIGQPGETLIMPIWRRLGMARDRVFELSWTANSMTALNSAFVTFVQGAS